MSDSSSFADLSLRREHLREQIADSIEGMIAATRLQPGDRLPSERDLAHRLGVNRATLREGIRLLEQRGLVQMKVGSGTFISGMPRSLVSDSIERYLAFGDCSHEELVVVREILEPEIAALAARQADADDLALLRCILDRLEEAFEGQDVSAYAEVDASFHEALAAATHNRLLTAIANGMRKPMRAWIHTQSQSRRLEEGARSHRLVLEAITARDPDHARDAMRAHMRTTRATL